MTDSRLVFVTGASGVVGRQVCRTLECSGIKYLTDAISFGRRFDLRTQDLAKALPRDVTHIIHLAAEIPNQGGRRDDERLESANVKIDSNVAHCLEKHKLYGIYFSSCGLYRRDVNQLQTERSPIFPSTPYFRSKALGEVAFLSLEQTTVFRISAPFGPELNRGFVLDRFMTAAQSGGELGVWGTGAREQDFISTTDIASAVTAALNTSAVGCFNIASGKPTRMDELAKLFETYIGGRVVRDQKPDPNEFERARIDISAAQQVLDWSPQLSLDVWLRGEHLKRRSGHD